MWISLIVFTLLYAVLAVILFMMFYYTITGVFADLALLLNLVLILAAMAMIRGTFTLPGIAGTILSLAMAVDANVLILERVREELQLGPAQADRPRDQQQDRRAGLRVGQVDAGVVAEPRRSQQRVQLDREVEDAPGDHADGHAHQAHRGRPTGR